MTRQEKWELWSGVGFGVLLAVGMLTLGDAGDLAPVRAPGPDLEAALRDCREDLATHHAVQGDSNKVRPWSERAPGDTTRRPR